MIRSAEVKNFKCLEYLSLDEFGKLTLIGGKNNVGKSALLEALFLFFDRMNPNQVARQYGWRGLGSVDTRPESLWAPIFTDYDLKRVIRVCVKYRGRTENLHVKLQPGFRPPSSPLSRGKKPDRIETGRQAAPTEALEFTYNVRGQKAQRTYAFVDRQQGPIQYVEHLSGSIPPVSYLSSRNRPTLAEDAKSFGELDKTPGRAELAVEFLRVIEPRLKDLSVIPEAGESVIYGDVGLGRKIPVVFMGDGVSRLLSILLAMVRSREGVLLVDEFENGFHHSIQGDVWNAASQATRELQCQLIATTHSREFIRHACEAVAGEFADDFRYVRLDQTDEGVVARTYNHKMLQTAIAANMEIR